MPLRVVGVLVSKGQGSWGNDADDLILVPLETGRRRLRPRPRWRCRHRGAGASATPSAPRQASTVQQIRVGRRAEDLAFVEERSTR